MNAKRQIIKAMAVIRRPRDGALLVSEPADGSFARPLGGHVEFGTRRGRRAVSVIAVAAESALAEAS